MHRTDLTNVDLNLLRALHALLIERHVTRAAARIHLSQPAMSRALAKLRELFGDELLVRVGQRMTPTPRAEALMEPVEHIVGLVGALVSSSAFDPSTARGTFRLAAPDILTYMLVPRLLRRLAREAPNVDVRIVEWSHRWREHLESGEIDLTVGQPGGGEPGIYSRLLVRNTWACVLRRGHAATRGRWTKERYASLSHLLISFTGEGDGQVDAALARFGLRRRVALRVPYVVLSPLLVAESDLVLTTARWLAVRIAKRAPLIVKDPPVPLAPVDLPMVWHERSHRDPRQRWIRGLLASVAEAEQPIG